MSELFNTHERNQIARIMTHMDVAYNQHDISVLQTNKDGLFDYINDLVVRKVTEQQIEQQIKKAERERRINNDTRN